MLNLTQALNRYFAVPAQPQRRARAAPPPQAFTSTDGGRAEAGFAGERRDCSVRAWALATGLTYAQAHGAFNAAGRRSAKGTSLATSVAVMGPAVATYLKAYRPTYAKWLKEHGAGTYVVHTAGHAFAVRDGAQLDLGAGLYKPRARVIRFWRIS